MNQLTQSWWESKSLSEMTPEEWESLCDGCGKCCLVKIQDAESGRIYFTDVGCKLLDCQTGLCLDYAHRQQHVPDCVKLSAQNLEDLEWMPPDCAYRRLYEHKPLAAWHPLITKDRASPHVYGASIVGMPVFSELDVPDDELEDHFVTWPLDRVG